MAARKLISLKGVASARIGFELLFMWRITGS